MTASPRAPTILLASLLLCACSAIRFGGDPVPDVAGRWRGSVTVEGQGIPGTLDLRQVESALEGVFRAPALDLTSDATGEMDEEGALWLEMRYDVQCPGNARFEGRLSEDGQRITGAVRASDCTGIVTGTFSLSRS